MNFVAIDFETANQQPTSACAIGLSIVKNGILAEKMNFFIKPEPNYYSFWNTNVHGLTAKDTADAPTFEELWLVLLPLLQDKTLVAHNAAFDMNVLRKCLAYYDLPLPIARYYCTVSLSRKTNKPYLQKHNLANVCQLYKIPLNHHNAESDAHGAAQIVLHTARRYNIYTIEDLYLNFGINAKMV